MTYTFFAVWHPQFINAEVPLFRLRITAGLIFAMQHARTDQKTDLNMTLLVVS